MRNANFANLKSNFSEKNVDCVHQSSSQLAVLPFPCCSVFSFLLELANIWLFTNHFSLALFAYQIDLEWTKCKWESGSPGEFLGETMWVLSSKWSPTSVLCAPGRQCEFEMQWGENIYLLQRDVVCVWTDFWLGESRNLMIHFCTVWAQPQRNLYKPIESASVTLPPTMSLIHSLIRHNVLGWAFFVFGVSSG